MYFYLSKILAPFLNPTNLLFLTLIIFFVLYYKNKKKIFSKFIITNILLLLFISFLPIGNLGIKFLEKDFLNKERLQNIDNIIVLSGSDKRIISSIKLANMFENSKIYFVGGNPYLIKSPQNDDIILAKNFYEDLNFNIKRINFIGKSRNTIENIKEIKKLNIDYSKTVLITSAFHMKRSLMIAKKFNLNLQPYATDFKSHSKQSILNRYQVFDVASNLNKFNLFFREILGMLTFKLTA